MPKSIFVYHVLIDPQNAKNLECFIGVKPHKTVLTLPQLALYL